MEEDASFRELYGRVAAHVKANRRWPTQAPRRLTVLSDFDDESLEEMRLRSELDRHIMKGRLPNEHRELLEELRSFPGWPECKVTWMQRYRVLLEYMESNGHEPPHRHSYSNPREAAEAGLADWVRSLQSEGRERLSNEIEEVDILVFQSRASLLDELPFPIELPSLPTQTSSDKDHSDEHRRKRMRSP